MKIYQGNISKKIASGLGAIKRINYCLPSTSCVLRLDSTKIQWVLISRRNIPLIFVKRGKQVPFHVYIHLSHVTHICLVMVKMFHWKWEYLVKLYSSYFVVFLLLLVRALEYCLVIMSMHYPPTLRAIPILYLCNVSWTTVLKGNTRLSL